jgi:hypothetical protein
MDPIVNGITLGSNPASFIGNQSIEQIQNQNGSQYTALADLISTFASASVGTQNLQDGSVTNEKIANLTFGKAFGGQITIGGNNNGDGIIKVQSSSNQLILQEDNLGLHLYDISNNDIITLDHLGLHLYNTSGNQLVLLDSLGLHTYNGSGTILSEFTSGGLFAYGATTFNFKQNPSSAVAGVIGVTSGGTFTIGSNNSNALQIAGASTLTLASLGTDMTLVSNNNINISPVGSIFMYGQKVFFSNTASDYEFGLSGTTPTLLFNGNLKSAIVLTTKGYRALYTNESPEVWFMDFCWGKRKWWKFWKKEYEIAPDPLFLEMVEGELLIVETGTKNIVQVWGHRRGYTTTRFEKKTKQQFDKNNEFWNTPNI